MVTGGKRSHTTEDSNYTTSYSGFTKGIWKSSIERQCSAQRNNLSFFFFHMAFNLARPGSHAAGHFEKLLPDTLVF